MTDFLLAAAQFRQDPRIKEAKKLLLDALKDYQAPLTHIRPPQDTLNQSYEEMIAAFNEMRGGKLYFPYIGSGFGNGPLVELLDGSVKYDMISGIGSHYWGHSHPDVLSHAIDAALNDTVMQGHLQQNIEAFHFSQLLVHASGLDHCFLSSSGAMANENALKIAFQKKFPASRVLAFEKCFMGRSLALSQITDKPHFREGLPTTIAVDYIPFFREEEPEKSTKQAVHTLKHYLARYPKQHAVMCFELVQGEGGFYTGTTDFFRALMTVLKEHEIAIFIDEVQTFGRTPQLFAYQHFQLEEFVDIVSIGKLSQVCATLFRSTFKPKPGLLSQTFTSSTAALQVGRFIVNELLHKDFLGPNGKIAHMHRLFVEHFERIKNRYPDRIQGPYGIGAMIAFTPFDGDNQRVVKFIQDLFQAGVISFVAGGHPTRARFLIPIGAIQPSDIEKVMELVEDVLKKG
ncbi:aminotransferase class III-fold pyridoxal phosphate-dependent enzyme [Candidatus Protochlamydia phocaeensis]|uniref:aminotransferase class III-fold pyridoxal phosphate-dependent enzyme n=1 Tax=Candidatus Protochlamydia phocaeensis TaxID=1414722 RepID=UPI0008385C22|nr:aminotransferase class III-fold pyridoxal phosphate-dependent enzyme [Candidatus Protochlamydia phocaeensis]